MSELAGVRSPHLSILPRVLPLDGLLPRLHLGRLLHHHHLPPQHLRQHLLLLLPRLLLPHQEQLTQSSVLHGDHNNNECPHQCLTLSVALLQYGVSIGSVLFVELVSVIISFVYRHSLSQALQEGIFLSMERFETRASNDGRHGGSQSPRRPLLGPSHG